MVMITAEPIDPRGAYDMIASEDAFAACKSGIGRLKKMRCIVKNEVCG